MAEGGKKSVRVDDVVVGIAEREAQGSPGRGREYCRPACRREPIERLTRIGEPRLYGASLARYQCIAPARPEFRSKSRLRILH
jgi:hypothetical protein